MGRIKLFMNKNNKRTYRNQFQQAQQAEAAVNAVYASAGRKAYAIIIPVDGCIYTDPKAKSLWLAGYKNAEREASWQNAPYARKRPMSTQIYTQKNQSTGQEE
jgi:hypothetical protein